MSATALAGFLVFASLPAAAETMATVAGNVSPWATKAIKVGTAPESRTVDIAVHMMLRDQAGLKAYAASVSKPGSADYGRYLSKDEVAARYAPDAADVDAVKTLLKGAGMRLVEAGPMGAYVKARATVRQLRATFGVTQDLYNYGDLQLRANKEAPSIPAALSGKILFIEGLDDSSFLRRPFYKSATRAEVATSRVSPQMAAPETATAAIIAPPVAANLPSPYCSGYFGDHHALLSTKPGPYKNTLPWLICGYTPQQVRQAYGLNKVKYDGTGITVAILDAYAAPTLKADANQYAINHKLPPLTDANFKQIIPDGIYDVSPAESCGPQGWFGEQSLDVDAVHGAAPGAKIVYIGARNCETPLTLALLNAIYNVEADVITNSYGNNGESINPGDVATFDQAGAVAAAQGQTILFSSGDDGDLSQVNGVASGAWTATSPWVTGVGGTSLALYGSGGAKDEWGWGNARDYLNATTVNSATSITTSGLATTSAYGHTYYSFSFYAGSGGGVSLLEPQPSYQAGIVPSALSGFLDYASGYSVPLPAAQRVSPDVAMVGDPYTGYIVGESYTIAGNATADAGCTATSATVEYCETDVGGTSLASPLMAGMIAVVNQAHQAAGKPLVGFANPWLYGIKTGAKPGSAGLVDVTAPATPVALLRGYANDLTRVRVVTINSLPFDFYSTPFVTEPCGLTICEGLNDVFNLVTPGYDDVTGLGTPYAPDLIKD